LCISWTNKRFDNIKTHGATLKKKMAEYFVTKYKRTIRNNIIVAPTEITLVYGLELMFRLDSPDR